MSIFSREPTVIVRARSCELLLESFKLPQPVKQVVFEAHYLPSGAFFWLDKGTATNLGKALQKKPSTLRNLMITVTMVEGGALDLVTKELPASFTLDEFAIAHKSGDEVTIEEAQQIARLITASHVKKVTIWAGEYDEGALDAFAKELGKLENKTLVEYDICDVSIPEPDDVLNNELLDKLVQKNKALQFC